MKPVIIVMEDTGISKLALLLGLGVVMVYVLTKNPRYALLTSLLGATGVYMMQSQQAVL